FTRGAPPAASAISSGDLRRLTGAAFGSTHSSVSTPSAPNGFARALCPAFAATLLASAALPACGHGSQTSNGSPPPTATTTHAHPHERLLDPDQNVRRRNDESRSLLGRRDVARQRRELLRQHPAIHGPRGAERALQGAGLFRAGLSQQ